MKNLLKYSQLWIPFIYAMAISGIALFGWSRSTITMSAGFPAYVAFLPMAFFFSALYTQNQISRLEKRIGSLEKQAGSATGEVST